MHNLETASAKVVTMLFRFFSSVLCTVEKFKFSEFLLDDKNATYLSSKIISTLKASLDALPPCQQSAMILVNKVGFKIEVNKNHLNKIITLNGKKTSGIFRGFLTFGCHIDAAE